MTDHDAALTKAKELLELLTLEEKCFLIGGHRGFFIGPLEKIGLPEIYMSDATQGLHLRDEFWGDSIGSNLDKSTAFPCFVQVAAAWNPELAAEYAVAVGEECKAEGVGILLGPGMNIYRLSQCGRNFEYLGEDPFLASRIIESYVSGLQSTGTVATLKHFVANNTDFFRRRSNSIVDERALREIYMPAFEAGIDAGAKAIMTSYNLLNGEWCGESDTVINGLLRTELGFEWLVMTDWLSVYDGENVVSSGQDLEMPKADAVENAADLVRQGKVEERQIDRMALSILKTCVAAGFLDGPVRDETYVQKLESHKDVALKAAEEGNVLLKNTGALPLQLSQKILVTGKFVHENIVGGGSGAVGGYDWLTLADALKCEFSGGLTFDESPSDMVIAEADVVILSVGTADSEGWDRPFSLPKDEEESIRRMTAQHANVVVVVYSGSGIRMTDWADSAAAILYAWYGGQQGNVAVARILAGKANPSGKLPFTIEKEFADSPGASYLPNGEELYSGWPEQGGTLHPVYDITYDEGIFVGYRWYERENIEPLFPFGYGLSYTTFLLSDLRVPEKFSEAEDTLTISFTVKNTGEISGAEVCQVYIADVACSVERPAKELKGFKKVFLQPGEEKNVEVPIRRRDLAYWSDEFHEWRAEPGVFEVLVGTSSRDIALRESFDYN